MSEDTGSSSNHEEGADTTQELAIAIQVEVGEKIPLPPAVRQEIEHRHIGKRKVYWNYEKSSDMVVISREALSDSDFVDVGRSVVHDVGDHGNPDLDETRRIDPPSDLDVLIKTNLTTADRLMYLARKEMIDHENPRCYLLNSQQLKTLLSSALEPDEYDADDIREPIVNNPGFIPSI